MCLKSGLMQETLRVDTGEGSAIREKGDCEDEGDIPVRCAPLWPSNRPGFMLASLRTADQLRLLLLPDAQVRGLPALRAAP